MSFRDSIPQLLFQFKDRGGSSQKEILISILEGIFVKTSGEVTPIQDLKIKLYDSVEAGHDPVEQLREFFQETGLEWRRNISSAPEEDRLVDEADIELFESTTREWLQTNEQRIRERAVVLAKEYGYRPPRTGETM